MSTNINDQQRTAEPSVAEMADIMDFDDSYAKTTQEHPKTTRQDEEGVIEVEPIEGEEDPINHQFDPEQNVTKVGFRKSGTAKTVLVGSLGLVGIVGAASLFQGQMPKEPVAEAPKKKNVVEEQVEQAQSAVIKAQQSESEVKAQLALSRQQESLEQANSANKNKPAETSNPDSNSNNSVSSNSNPDPNKVATSAAPAVPVVPINANRNASQGLANASSVLPIAANRNNPGQGLANAFATAPSLAFKPTPVTSKNIPGSLVPVGRVQPAIATALAAASRIPIAAAPGAFTIPTRPEPARPTPVKTFPKLEPVRENPSRIIAKAEPIRQTPVKTEPPRSLPVQGSAESPRLPIARAPGLPGDSTPSSPSLNPGGAPGGGAVVSPAVAINSTPSLSDFLKTSAAANNSPQTIAFDKGVDIKYPKPALPIVPAPGVTAQPTAPSSMNPSIAIAPVNKEQNLVASNSSPNAASVAASSLTNIQNLAPVGIQTADFKTVVSPAQPAAPTINFNSTRPAFNHSKTILSNLPDSKISLNLGTNESASSGSQINKTQFITETSPVLNQPLPALINQNPPTINPVTPSGSLGPIASSLLTGSSAKGTTLTPILWGSGATGAKFMARLEEPLLANNKREALPAGTQLIVTAKPNSGGNNNSNNSSNSLVEIDVVGVIIQGREYTTPAGSLVIHDENNGLLVGEDYFKREEQIASRDYLTVLGGALNSLGQVLNRPNGSFSSTTSGIGSSSTSVVNNNERNVFGALLEGGFKDIPNIWNQRNQEALSQLANQPKVYQIPKGRTIRVFVNQSINF
jgi:Bacterial conjugation TrbI-like protein